MTRLVQRTFLVLLLLGMVLFPHLTFAANATFTQTNWSAGASSNTAIDPTNQSGWAYSSTTASLVATTTIQVATTSAAFSEGFTTTAKEDVTNTNVTWDTAVHQLGLTAATVSNLHTKISGILGSGAVQAEMYVNTAHTVYIGSDGGKFVSYDVSSGVATDLTAQISSFWSTNAIYSFAYDATHNLLYIGGNSGKFASYNGTTATDLTAQISSFWSTNTINALTYDATHNLLYIGGNSGKFASYNGTTATDLTAQISSFWSTTPISSLTYDATHNLLYIGGNSGKFASYNGTTATDLTAQISSFWVSHVIYALSYDATHNLLYLGGDGGRFASYNGTTATDLTAQISSFWSTNYILSLAYDTAHGVLYLGGWGSNGLLASYNGTTATNLSPTISSFWGTNFIYALTYDSTNNQIYLGGGTSSFATTAAVCASNCVAQSTAVDSTSQNILSATLTKADTPGTGSIAYYLSNDGGVNFNSVTPGTPYTFTTTGSDLRWKTILNGNATVQSVSLSYIYYSASGTLTSSAYDSGNSGNVIGGVQWTENSTLPTGSTATFSLRTAPNLSGLYTATYADFTDVSANCTNVAGVVTCSSAAISSGMKDGVNDQWFQYKVGLTSTGTSTPVITSAGVTYSLAATPAVTTSAATPVTQTTATLNGTVTALGGANVTTSGFAWGTVATLSGGDTATTTTSGATSTVPALLTTSLSSLTCGTTYYARAYATNSAGDGLGIIVSFAASACPVTTQTSVPTVASPSAISIPMGGSGAPNPLPGATATPAPATSNSSGLSGSQVQSVLALLRAFNVDQATITNVSEILHGSFPSTAPAVFTFTRNLSLHDTGADVLALQQYLNAHGFSVAVVGLGSLGHETITFGPATYRALVKFQAAHGLPQSGFFGAMTRGVVGD